MFTVVPPGNYELRGKMRGRLTTKRGLQWQVRCASPKGPTIGHSDRLADAGDGWTAFAFRFSVPSDPTCLAQQIALVHGARSASEEFIEGVLWFDSLTLGKIDRTDEEDVSTAATVIASPSIMLQPASGTVHVSRGQGFEPASQPEQPPLGGPT